MAFLLVHTGRLVCAGPLRFLNPMPSIPQRKAAMRVRGQAAIFVFRSAAYFLYSGPSAMLRV
ncbi:MAG: hypothetical protein CMI59_03090 [Parvibaculum sp.]|nr:hypothetical protein [Parvibaculum sp.]|tara:strand:+ start:249 stop:434 length:186 start_codon:yes stop_codon:yes gene_type:complete